MPNVSEITLDGRIMALFVGPNGNGKTIALSSFPKPMRIYDFDGRLKPLVSYYKRLGWSEELDQISYISVGPGNLLNFVNELVELTESCPYKTVAIDSATGFSVTAMTFQLGDAWRNKRKGEKSAGGLVIPGFDDYKGETSIVTQTLDICKALPCNVIWTAHPLARIEVSAGGGGRIGQVVKKTDIVAYGSKVASLIPNYFDEIYNFEKVSMGLGDNERTEYIFSTDGLGSLNAKTALPLPKEVRWTDKKLYQIIKEVLDKEHITIEV